MKNKLTAIIFVTSAFVTTAANALICESTSPGNFFCEATFGDPMSNTYAWTSSGDISISGGSGPFVMASCLGSIGPINDGEVQVEITHPGGTTQLSSTIPCSSPDPDVPDEFPGTGPCYTGICMIFGPPSTP